MAIRLYLHYCTAATVSQRVYGSLEYNQRRAAFTKKKYKQTKEFLESVNDIYYHRLRELARFHINYRFCFFQSIRHLLILKQLCFTLSSLNFRTQYIVLIQNETLVRNPDRLNRPSASRIIQMANNNETSSAPLVVCRSPSDVHLLSLTSFGSTPVVVARCDLLRQKKVLVSLARETTGHCVARITALVLSSRRLPFRLVD